MPAPAVIVHKYHALGNDFLVAFGPGCGPTGQSALPPTLHTGVARRLCHRRRGIGADGLVLVDRAPVGPAGGWSFRLWNADGSEAEMSGNGLRCAAHALAEAGLVPGWGSPAPVALVFSTPAGPRSVQLRPAGGPGRAWGTVDMGPVGMAPVNMAPVGTAPVDMGTVDMGTVGMAPVDLEGGGRRGGGPACNVDVGRLQVVVGNPHLVVLGPDPATVDVATLGPALEAGAAGGRNVEFVALGPGPDEVTMRVWERGVGETEACGTGSCAAAAALYRWGRVGPTVTVHQPGGAMEVTLGADGTARLGGPSEQVATCVVVPQVVEVPG